MIYTSKSVRREEGFRGNKNEENTALNAYNQAVLRVLVRVRTPKILRLLNEKNQKIKVGTKIQTWDHLLLFESNLFSATPLKSQYKLEQYQEWLGFLMRKV